MSSVEWLTDASRSAGAGSVELAAAQQCPRVLHAVSIKIGLNQAVCRGAAGDPGSGVSDYGVPPHRAELCCLQS